MTYDYTYTQSDNTPVNYIFEIKITNIENENTIYRLATNIQSGDLIKVDNNIKKIIITLINLENMKVIKIKKTFNELIYNNLVLYKQNYIITLMNIDDMVIIKYQL